MRRSASIMNRNLFSHLRGVPALLCFAVFSLYQLTVPNMAMADEFGLSYYVHSGGNVVETTRCSPLAATKRNGYLPPLV